MDLLSEEQYYDILGTLPDKNQHLEDNDEKKFITKIGGEAIKELLKRVEIESLSAELRVNVHSEPSVQKKQELLKRLAVVEASAKGKRAAE
jgi:DNA-directed RNA polymerase subunit beta' (EC 2.7.7.6)